MLVKSGQGHSPRGIWQDFTARCVWWGDSNHSPPKQPASLSSPPLPVAFWWKYLFLKRANEQTRRGIPLNKPSLFRIPALLFKQSLGAGGLPTPLPVWERPLEEGRRRNAGQLLHPADSWEDRGPLEGKPPAGPDLNAEAGSAAATYRLCPRGSSAHLRNGKNTSCCIISQVAMSTGSETWEDRGREAGTRRRPPRHPRARRFGTSPRSAVWSLRSRNTLH